MIGRPPGHLRLHPCEPQLGKIERLDTDRTDRMIQRRSSHRDIRATTSADRDPPLQQTVPIRFPANHLGGERESQRTDHQKHCVFAQPGSEPTIPGDGNECLGFLRGRHSPPSERTTGNRLSGHSHGLERRTLGRRHLQSIKTGTLCRVLRRYP